MVHASKVMQRVFRGKRLRNQLDAQHQAEAATRRIQRWWRNALIRRVLALEHGATASSLRRRPGHHAGDDGNARPTALSPPPSPPGETSDVAVDAARLIQSAARLRKATRMRRLVAMAQANEQMVSKHTHGHLQTDGLSDDAASLIQSAVRLRQVSPRGSNFTAALASPRYRPPPSAPDSPSLLSGRPAESGRRTRVDAPPDPSSQEGVDGGHRSRVEAPTAKGLLQAYDTGHDGQLSRHEFTVLLRDLVRSSMVLRPVTRMHGKWSKPPADLKEPERTERLLASPFALRRGCAADCQDSMSTNLFGNTSGTRFLGICFAWASMLVQVLCGIISGVGPYITRGTRPADAQVLLVAFVKLAWAAVLYIYAPCVCLLVNAVIMLQVR